MCLGSRVRCLTDCLRRGDGRRIGGLEEHDGHAVCFSNTIGNGTFCHTVSDANGNARS
ncbi:hypothetical protein NNX28_14940 [Arthrobacter sp. zg-Y859]|uniref:Uncharacterized protein n=1 Tax=Arthrobacter jinronghuae TaxID=2964609 RepID=A0ABT1NU06_9MICC|nr:hypothetical protein [Arthrobacter jinronghuae]MCQ1951216.1 hypothetical protein [Arthrobacter jinronghuae]UWX79009.1 hypothetical protein N2K98_01970 [Arthrobacter jinronghuae]